MSGRALGLACVLLASPVAAGEPAPAFGEGPPRERPAGMAAEPEPARPAGEPRESDDPRTRWHPGWRTTARVDGEAEPGEPEPVSDGTYGRFEGDMDLGVGLGAELLDGAARGAARLSLHYYWMIGIYAGYRDALGGGADPEQRVSVGVDVRPLFIPRWARNMPQGPGFFDLTLDSLSLALGAFWAAPRDAAFGDSRGFEGSLGLGVPLFARATGLWLEGRGQMRWADGDDGAASVLVMLSWHQLFVSPLARAVE